VDSTFNLASNIPIKYFLQQNFPTYRWVSIGGIDLHYLGPYPSSALWAVHLKYFSNMAILD